MSYPLLVGLTSFLSSDPTLISLLGTDPDGQPTIYPLHFRDVENPIFPMITISRFGSGMKDNMFTDDPVYGGNRMENPKLAICVWDKQNIDLCYAIYDRVDTLLRGSPPVTTIPSHYFVNYKWQRKTFRDDLFDTEINAYHLHSEYETWVYTNKQIPIPAPQGTV